MSSREYQTVLLAALLHDIGKFLQRGRSLPIRIEGTHPEVSAQFISAFEPTFGKVADPGLLKTLVQHHHRDPRFSGPKLDDLPEGRARDLARLVNRADGLSASERGEHADMPQNFRTTPLASVFPRVFASDNAERVYNHHPSPLTGPDQLSRESLFPSPFDKYAMGELERTLQDFGRAADPILKALGADFDALVCHLLTLFHSYLWAVPADTQEEIPDISLYDHLRTTAAIAACLYLVCDEGGSWDRLAAPELPGQPFCLAVGDVSGIQDYIFNIATGAAAGGGVAKRLRARSLFVQLISEVLPLQVLNDFDLPLTNVLMASGGKFYLLVPNLKDTGAKLTAVQERVDRWFLQKMDGAMALNLAWVCFGEKEFKTFGDVLARAMGGLASRKEQRFREALLTEPGRWKPHAFVFPAFPGGFRPCPSCGRFPVAEQDETPLCAHCETDKTWGAALKDTRYVVFSGAGGTGGRDVVGSRASLTDKPPGLKEMPQLMLGVNNPDTHQATGLPASFRYLVNHVPLDRSGALLDFQQIADQSAGRHYLGFLKADVDGLGEVFAFGLRGKNEQRADTISRLATLSRQMDLFFTGWVEHLLESEFQTCYAVFSGGDDLFLAGPWNVILDLAGRLREDFQQYTCGNPGLTLSAGLVIAPAHLPVSQAARQAEDAVEKSKHNPGKDSITLLGHTVKWGEWDRVRAEWEKLKGERVSSAFLYSLLEYGSMWRRWKDEHDVLGLRFQPLLAYNISRNVSARDNAELYNWAKSLVDYRPGEKDKELILDNLGLLAQLLILGKETRE